MKNFTFTLFIVCAFLTGCFASKIVDVVIPSLEANQSTIQKWEYKYVTFGSAWTGINKEKLNTELNKLGSEGWELETSTGSTKVLTLCFKRPLQ